MATDTDLMGLRVEVVERCGGTRGGAENAAPNLASFADAFLLAAPSKGMAATAEDKVALSVFATLEAISSTLLMHELEVTSVSFESARVSQAKDLGRFKASCAMLFGTLDNLQMKKIDAVLTDGIAGEDAVAAVRLLRKQLGKRCSRCREQVETLHDTLKERIATN